MAKKAFKLDFTDIREFEKRLRDTTRISGDVQKIGLLKIGTLVHRHAVQNTVAGVKYPDGVYEVGNLRRALTFEVEPNQTSIFISKGLKYPTFVERGTRRMRAKPFLSLALKDNMENIKNILKTIIERQLRNLKK